MTVQLGPVCVFGNQWGSLGKPITQTVHDYAGKHQYHIPALASRSHLNSSLWLETLILAWYTCEGNLYHMMHETLGPINHAIEIHSIQNAHVAIVKNPWPPSHQSNCHNMNFRPLYKAINVSVLYHLSGDTITFNPAFNTTRQMCYRKAIQVVPETHGTLNQKILTWANNQASCNNSEPRIVIVQRNASRKIGNVDRLYKIALEYTPDVRVVVLENMPIHKQIQAMTCGKLIVAGVHGAGLAWTQLLKTTGRRSVLIEWTWKNWRSYYTMRSRSSSVLAIESIIPTNQTWCPDGYTNNCCKGDCNYPTKHLHVNVSDNSWRKDLDHAFSHFITV